MQGFHFITTEDGSPSLRLGETEALSEAMHSLKGAFSETCYIYGAAMARSIELGFEPRVLSMGLGLGYVELLAAGYACRHPHWRGFGGESFEIVPDLRDYFLAWLRGERVPEDFARTYDEVERLTCRHFDLPGGSAKASLAAALTDGRWLIREALTPSTIFEGTFGTICFDAFSSKSTPDLWTEDFLTAFLTKTAAPGCVLSTYACTGALKRALRGAEFDVTIREGFSSKRDSTFAARDPVSKRDVVES